MTLPVFWLPAPLDADPTPGDVLALEGHEARHAVTVRRLRVGEHLHLVDGSGLRVDAEVVVVGRDRLEARVASVTRDPSPSPRLVAVQALAKGERSEQAVESLTEVGVDVLVPWAASRCVVQWRGERGQRSLARWRSTAHAAAKQARRPRAPEVRPLAGTAEVAALLAQAALPVLLHESATRPLAGLAVPGSGDVVVVVGPEGGISDEELALLAVPAVSLGSTVLRTSTAGVAASAALLARTGRWA